VLGAELIARGRRSSPSTSRARTGGARTIGRTATRCRASSCATRSSSPR
jgi:hypothetical protein